MQIRKGKPEDVSAALQLIKELAEFEKAPEQVTNTSSNARRWIWKIRFSECW